jgi:glycosyltransferase involved in cell wall biosynthesis
VLLILAIVLAFVALGTLGVLIEGYRATPSLADVEPALRSASPRVSIVVAARDEVQAVADAARSLLAQQYPDIEVVIVDDRSTDGTSAVLDALAKEEPRLCVVHLDSVPTGWLGKTHALHRGAAAASGELLLFTDGDVMLHAETVARAVAFMLDRGADHLTLGPDLDARSVPLALVVNFFIMSFMLFQRPWRAVDPKSRDHIGIGAFNLVRREAYERAGGHERVRLRPDDDLKLGKALKASGARQLFANGKGFVTVEWYRSLGEMTRGLRKNAFAGMEYRVGVAALAVLSLLVLHVLPFVLVWTSEGLTRWLFAITCLALMAAYAYSAQLHQSRPWLVIFYPLAALVFAWIFARNVVLTLIEGGIEWRGTKYALRDLKRNRV